MKLDRLRAYQIIGYREVLWVSFDERVGVCGDDLKFISLCLPPVGRLDLHEGEREREKPGQFLSVRLSSVKGSFTEILHINGGFSALR